MLLLEEDTSEDLRVLRLKHYLDADANTTTISRVLSALEHCKTVEALYIHNFEEGMQDEQLTQLSRVLRNGRIWARRHPLPVCFQLNHLRASRPLPQLSSVGTTLACCAGHTCEAAWRGCVTAPSCCRRP